MTLSALDLSWSAGRTTIVKDVSLRIETGEVFCLVGPNGSGKSTLLLLLAGLRAPSTGRVMLADDDLRNFTRRDIAKRIAIVVQQLETMDRLTVRESVELGRTPWLGPLTPYGDSDDDIVSDALAKTGIEDLAERRWQTLSGGERQRAHIARALAQQADILILDEPTNHLDIRHQLAILDLVNSLPVTVVMALHDLNQAMDCDRVGVMHNGLLQDVGAPHDVLHSDRIRDVFEVSSHRVGDPEQGDTFLRFRLP